MAARGGVAIAGAEEEAHVTSVVDIVLPVKIPTSTAKDVMGPAMEVPAVEVLAAIEIPAADVVVPVAGVESRMGKEPWPTSPNPRV